MQRKLLGYSFKRSCQYVPKNYGNKSLRRIAYIKHFLRHLKEKKTVLFVLDEMGIGTSPLRRYGYSKVGTPCVLERG
jgi:hypothetical protein